jgi:hypothetical protein
MSPEIKPTNEAFERFRTFAQKVIAVPKAEIDKRAKAYAKARKALRAAKA